jgi:hypothetical protein
VWGEREREGACVFVCQSVKAGKLKKKFQRGEKEVNILTRRVDGARKIVFQFQDILVLNWHVISKMLIYPRFFGNEKLT